MEKRKNRQARRLTYVLAGALLVASFQGCASSSQPTVPRASAGKVQRLDAGTVVAVKEVRIDGEASYLGISSGAILGSAVGQTVGGGNDARIISGAVGAVAGAVVGQQVEKKLTEKRAQEVTISMDDGQTVVVVQEAREAGFVVGDRVNVMETRTGEARIALSDFGTDGLYQSPRGI